MAKVTISTTIHSNTIEDFERLHGFITQDYLDRLVISKNLYSDVKLITKTDTIIHLSMDFQYFEDVMEIIAIDLNVGIKYKVYIEDEYIIKHN